MVDIYLYLVPAAVLLAVGFTLWSVRYIIKQPKGTPAMEEVANAIQISSRAFIKKQYLTIFLISLAVGGLLYFALDFFRLDPFPKLPLIGLGFLFGSTSSLLSGIIGLEIATRTNVRTTFAAKESLNKSLRLAFLGGSIIGLAVMALSLFGVTILYFLFGGDPKTSPTLIIGFGFGASFSALFAQLGGGIFTKAADVGADLVGKIEAGIPEDDPRNPAVIADLVGDQVGDCAGRQADLFESSTAENIGSMIVGIALYAALQPTFGDVAINFIFFPLVARALGIMASFFGIGVLVATEKNKNPIAPLRNGLIATTLLMAGVFYFLIQGMLGPMGAASLYLYGAALVGLGASIAIQLITEYYTGNHRPVMMIAKASTTGHATNITTGFAMALEATALPIIVLAVALISSYGLGSLYGGAMGISTHTGAVYGTAVATMAMLSVAGMVLALDGYGPIVDNAGGIAEMADAEKEIRDKIDILDATGNTTKALTKGYAMGSAALAAVLLFQAYLEEVGRSIALKAVDIIQPHILIGLFLGVLLPFIFSSFAIRAVGATASKVVEEVRRQFKTIPGLMEGKAKPDYARCVEISTSAALRQMILPTFLIVISLVLVGFILGPFSAGAFVIGATFTGIALAMLMNTGGGAWDNAKKFIEKGQYGGKKSPAHAAAVTGDTFGDPLKDCAGPSLHVLIKLLNMLSILLVPLFVTFALII